MNSWLKREMTDKTEREYFFQRENKFSYNPLVFHFLNLSYNLYILKTLEVFSYWERISTSIFWIDLDSVIWMGLKGPNCFFWIETQWTNYGKRPGDPEAEVEIVVPGEGVEWKKKVKRFRRSKAAKGHQKLQTSVISTYRITSNHVGLSFCNLAFGNRTVFNLNQLNRLQSNRLQRVRQHWAAKHIQLTEVF